MYRLNQIEKIRKTESAFLYVLPSFMLPRDHVFTRYFAGTPIMARSVALPK
jgi:hypothetical protein